MYTQKDLAVLGSAKELLGKGMRFREVLEQLREEQGGRRSREEAAPSRLSYPEGLEAGQLRALVEAAQASIRLTEGALAQWRTIAQEREKELIRLQRILEEREREIASLRNGVEAATAQIQELKAKVEELEGKKRWPFTR